MAEWKTISSRIKEDTLAAFKILCEREKVKPNEYVRKLIEKKVAPILGDQTDADAFPLIGQNRFEYDSDSDSYLWLVDFGSGKSTVISRNLSHFFVENIFNSLSKGMAQRKQMLKKLKKGKVHLPQAIVKYGVD